jgi:hypothetical protein
LLEKFATVSAKALSRAYTGVSGGEGSCPDGTRTLSEGFLRCLRFSVCVNERPGEASVYPKVEDVSLSSVSLPKGLIKGGASALRIMVSSVGGTARESEIYSSAGVRTSVIDCLGAES